MLGQPLVHERVVRRQHVEHAPVLTDLAVEPELGLPRERLAQVAVELGKGDRVRLHAPHVAEEEPLSREVVDQRGRLRIRQQAAHLRFENARLAQRAGLRRREQLVVRDAAPEEERQPRRELQIRDAVRRPRGRFSRIDLDAEEELGVDEDGAERELDAALEASPRPAGVVEPHQRVDVVAPYRPPERAPRQRRKDVGRARRLRLGGRIDGRAGEDALATRRCGSGVPGRRGVRTGVERPIDLDDPHRHRRVAVARVVVGLRGADRFEHTLGDGAGAGEREGYLAHPGRDRQPQAQILVGLALVRSQVEDRAPDLPLAVGADLELGHAAPVEPHLKPVAPLQSLDGVAVGPLQRHPDLVLAVHREVVPRCEAAPRAERVQLAHPVVLPQHRGRRVAGGRLADRRAADGELRDLAGGEHVALEERGRQRQHVGDVVEPVALVVGRQQLPAVDLQREQIADRVGVLGAVEAVDRLGARVRIRPRGRVDLVFHPVDEPDVGRVVGPRAPRGRHLAGAELADDLLPGLRPRADVHQVERFQGQSRRPQPVAVAGGAVAVQEGPELGRRARPGGARSGGLGGLSRGARHARRGHRTGEHQHRGKALQRSQRSGCRRHSAPQRCGVQRHRARTCHFQALGRGCQGPEHCRVEVGYADSNGSTPFARMSRTPSIRRSTWPSVL